MDFTKFSDENFDLKDWINGAFVSQKESNQNQEVSTIIFYSSLTFLVKILFYKKQFVATLITKLQVFIQVKLTS